MFFEIPLIFCVFHNFFLLFVNYVYYATATLIREDSEQTPIDDDGEKIPPPSPNEVRVAIERLKNNKAAVLDGFPAEWFKARGDELVRNMHQLICRIWLAESMPSDGTCVLS